MSPRVAYRGCRFAGNLSRVALILLIAGTAPAPVRANETCPCFSAQEVTELCEQIGGERTFGPSRGWGGLIETEGASIECSNPENGTGVYFEADGRPMKFSAAICTKLVARGTQDDVLQTEGVFEEHVLACRQQLEQAAEQMGGLKYLKVER